MKKTYLIALLMLTFLTAITACSESNKTEEKTTFVKFSGTDESYTITEGGTYSFSGKLDEGKITVETNEDVMLILSGVEITNSTEEAIKIEGNSIITIKTSKGTENTLSGKGDAAIGSKSSIVFEGSGVLNINGTHKHGVECDGDITVKSGTINVNSYEHGIKSESVITILGGNISIVAETGKGIKAEKEFLAENGNITINSIENEGIESKGALTINGGNFNITAGEDGINAGTSDSTSESSSENESSSKASHLAPEYTDATPEGGEGTGAVPPKGAQPDKFRPEGRIPMDGEGEQTENGTAVPENNERPQKPETTGGSERPEGMVAPKGFMVPDGATTSGRGIPFEHERQNGVFGGGMGKTNKDSVLTINGGTIRINCLGDGIDSNGSLTINGGTVIIDGPENSGNGPLDSDGEMIINGATVLTASSKGMTQMPKSMSQGIISFTFESTLSAGDEITIMDSDKKIIIEHKVKRLCDMLVFTSPDISIDGEYTIYVNGKEHTKVNAVQTLQNGFHPMHVDKVPFELDSDAPVS